MERIKALINKLQDQLQQQAGSQAMLMTVQLLHSELEHHANEKKQTVGTGKVAVLMPSPKIITPIEPDPVPPPVTIAAVEMPPAPAEIERPVEEVVEEEEEIPMVAHRAVENNSRFQSAKKESTGWLFDPVHEIPTLAHQKAFREINEAVGHNGESLNDRLRSGVTEIGNVLTETPIKDLRKGIGINDRFVFVNELFRGDNDMYERSIKTINNFRILPEAEYWMERELKMRLAWDDSKDIVKHFYSLVRRRFA